MWALSPHSMHYHKWGALASGNSPLKAMKDQDLGLGPGHYKHGRSVDHEKDGQRLRVVASGPQVGGVCQLTVDTAQRGFTENPKDQIGPNHL